MEYLALSIFLSTVLFLVDKNQAWRGFWRFSKWAGVAVLALVIAAAGYYSYQQRMAKNSLTPDQFMAQQDRASH